MTGQSVTGIANLRPFVLCQIREVFEVGDQPQLSEYFNCDSAKRTGVSVEHFNSDPDSRPGKSNRLQRFCSPLADHIAGERTHQVQIKALLTRNHFGEFGDRRFKPPKSSTHLFGATLGVGKFAKPQRQTRKWQPSIAGTSFASGYSQTSASACRTLLWVLPAGFRYSSGASPRNLAIARNPECFPEQL